MSIIGLLSLEAVIDVDVGGVGIVAAAEAAVAGAKFPVVAAVEVESS